MGSSSSKGARKAICSLNRSQIPQVAERIKSEMLEKKDLLGGQRRENCRRRCWPLFPLGLWLLAGSLCTGLPLRPAPQCHTAQPHSLNTLEREKSGTQGGRLWVGGNDNWDIYLKCVHRHTEGILTTPAACWLCLGAHWGRGHGPHCSLPPPAGSSGPACPGWCHSKRPRSAGPPTPAHSSAPAAAGAMSRASTDGKKTHTEDAHTLFFLQPR